MECSPWWGQMFTPGERVGRIGPICLIGPLLLPPHAGECEEAGRNAGAPNAPARAEAREGSPLALAVTLLEREFRVV